MGSIVNEALLELNSHLLEHPHKVLPALRMVKNSAFGTLKCKIPQEWIHHTLIYFYNISKELWRDVLMRYAKARQLPWTEELLKKCDRKYNLKGLELLSSFLGQIVWQDHLAKELHYKPMLVLVMLDRFMSMSPDTSISIDANTGEISPAPSLYAFDGAVDGRYTHIKHLPQGVKALLPEDLCVKVGGAWTIEDGHSWNDAYIKGARISENCFKLFYEQGLGQHIQYDTDSFLDNFITKHKKAHHEAMQRSWKEYRLAVEGPKSDPPLENKKGRTASGPQEPAGDRLPDFI